MSNISFLLSSNVTAAFPTVVITNLLIGEYSGFVELCTACDTVYEQEHRYGWQTGLSVKAANSVEQLCQLEWDDPIFSHIKSV